MTEKEAKKDNKEEESLKKETNNENRILKIIFIIAGIIIILTLAYFLYAPASKSLEYKGIIFTVEKIGNLTFYDTVTLANNSYGAPFGFRIRTNPNDLKNVPFDSLNNFNFTHFNVIKSDGNHTFLCEGYGIIAIVNLQRTFSEMGMSLIKDQNATCDPQGRYGLFMLKYGNETSINQIGNNCYEIEIKGNDSQCEILPATEKLMVDMYAKYINLSK